MLSDSPIKNLNRWLRCCLLLAPVAAFADTPVRGFADQFDAKYLEPLVQQTPGGAAVVIEGGKVTLQRVYGVREESVGGAASPVTDETLFRIASLSKTFASAAASILVKDTPVTWQTPLKASLAHLKFKQPEYGGRINLQHIMSQTSGLMPHAYTNLIEENMSYSRIVDRLNRVDFVCAPGQCYGYQNVVFSLVGDLVKSQTTMDYPAFVDRRIFQPLGMDRASFGHASFVEDVNHAEPHVWNGKRWRAIRPTSHYYKVPPAAGVNASISDLRQWLLAQLGGKPDVLEANMLDLMHQRVIKTSRHQAHYPYRRELSNIHYGLGWRIFDYGDQAGYVHHGGYVRGMTSAMVFHRPTQTGIVFLTNSEPRGMNELVLDFAEMHSDFIRQQNGKLAATSGVGQLLAGD